MSKKEKDVLENILEEIEDDKIAKEKLAEEEAEKLAEAKDNPFDKKKDKKDDDSKDDSEDDDMDDEGEDEDKPVKEAKKKKKVSEELEIDIKEDIDAIVKGTKLSEEHQKKVSTIFETALKAQVKKHVEKAEAFYEEKYKAELKENVLDLENKVDQYMNHVAETWLEENKLAVEQGIRADLVEGFVEDFKILCEKHSIEFTDDEINSLAESQEENADLTEKLDEAINKKIGLEKELKDIKISSCINSISEGLVETDKEKFVKLVEDVDYTSEEDYKEKLEIIKENYFKEEEDEGTGSTDTSMAGTNNIVTDDNKAGDSLADQAANVIKSSIKN